MTRPAKEPLITPERLKQLTSVLKSDHFGFDNRIKAEALMRKLEIPDHRKGNGRGWNLRILVEAARKAGTPIGSSRAANGGYYYIETKDELKATMWMYERSIAANQRQLTNLTSLMSAVG